MSDCQKDFLHGSQLKGCPLQGQQSTKHFGCDGNNRVHVSFDLDCIDPCIFNSVNTPVENGKSKIQMKYVFKKIKNSKKLQSLDVVEYNPDKGDEKDVIEELIKELF